MRLQGLLREKGNDSHRTDLNLEVYLFFFVPESENFDSNLDGVVLCGQLLQQRCAQVRQVAICSCLSLQSWVARSDDECPCTEVINKSLIVPLNSCLNLLYLNSFQVFTYHVLSLHSQDQATFICVIKLIKLADRKGKTCLFPEQLTKRGCIFCVIKHLCEIFVHFDPPLSVTCICSFGFPGNREEITESLCSSLCVFLTRGQSESLIL